MSSPDSSIEKCILININVDGVPLFKSTSYCLWVILGCVVGDGYKLFVISCYGGTTKPADANKFMKHFVDEMKDLEKNGIVVNNRRFCIKIKYLIFDAPARAFVTYTDDTYTDEKRMAFAKTECDKDYRQTTGKKLAYEFATALQKKIPKSWMRDKSAGPDWLAAFLKENSRLSIRTPEATSIGKATNFNRLTAGQFFVTFETIREKHGFTAAEIWNVDEPGGTTVQRLSNVFAERGVKQVGGITSSEREFW